jgi:hypothetical protein
MNEKNFQTLTEAAASICQKLNLTAAGIVCVDGKQITIMMSGPCNLDDLTKSGIILDMGSYLTRIGTEMRAGTAKIKEVEINHLDEMIQKGMDKDKPEEGTFFPN